MGKRIFNIFYLLLIISLLAGCESTNLKRTRKSTMSDDNAEATWIQNGEPIIYDGKEWFPQDGVEIFLDSEVSPIGKYRGTVFYIDKVDVKPYNRLYTKFDKNKYRYFEEMTE